MPITAWSLVAVSVQAMSALVCLTVAFMLWRRDRPVALRALVIAALGVTAVHLLANAPQVLDVRAVWLVTAMRNLVWLALIRALFAADGRHASLRPVGPVIVALAVAELAQVPLVALSEIFVDPAAFGLIAKVSAIFHMLFAIGFLVLVHNLYVGAGPQLQPRLRWMAGALVLGWGCELNVYSVAYLWGGLPNAVLIARAMAWGTVAVLLWFDARQKITRAFAPSRSVAFQSLSLLVIALYLFALFTLDGALARSSLSLGVLGRFGAVVLAVAIGGLIASRSLRHWLSEVVTRNLFRHRYDYREEWLRLSKTIAGRGVDAPPLEQRAVQALADIVDSPAGLLLAPGDDGQVTLAARWNWSSLEVPPVAMNAAALGMLERGGGIVSLDAVRDETEMALDRYLLPDWLIGSPRAWLMVPLLVEDRVIGVIVLARPSYTRRLDWEDHDILRIVAQQLAAHLAENRAQGALLEASRFEEFNRRIAFVMHDIKNLASQFSLMVSNAERHIEKPAFRADMLVTLRSASDRLEGLLGRLSGYGAHGQGGLMTVDGAQVVADALKPEIAGGLVAVGPGAPQLLADREALDQVLRHLVRNAIEASEPGTPVQVHFAGTDKLVGIEVIDKGCGMSPEFVRGGLFKPFVSTKNDGFGIGAFEAREMVRAMGGRLEVESRVGIGTRFIVWLPRANARIDPARKVA
ncbi:XrtA/PEP-CTERM system histidine kinase PrsK [Croceicoccus naphthovorans]|nr:XrtA/PEP-CTERM system histidine kinase PrsK [Croceicoccus naphthovorans]MBB3990724.1 putative PEP-CTERM system histidine kinase [Croceicoccus naphthovorans]